MIYYSVYVKNLSNGTGYVDVALEDDQLLKDFLQFLDIGIRSHRTYPLSNPGGSRGIDGPVAINLAEVIAITVTSPK